MSAALYSILFSPAGPQQGVTTATAYVGEETEPGIFRQGHTNRVPCIYMRALYKEMNWKHNEESCAPDCFISVTSGWISIKFCIGEPTLHVVP